VNLYGFVGNDGVNGIDSLGRWRIERKGTGFLKEWAPAYAEEGDTLRGLAKEIKLAPDEIDKWLVGGKSYGLDERLPAHKYTKVGESAYRKDGCSFLIPNTIAVYTSKSLWRWPPKDSVGSGAGEGRRVVRENAGYYKAAGFNVVEHYQKSDSDFFNSLWELSGIYGVFFGGHGSSAGFHADPVDGFDSDPSQVSPPYKLARIIAATCNSADPIIPSNIGPDDPSDATVSWSDHLAPGGSLRGNNGLCWLWTVPREFPKE
jgi:hypothetical protein